jgi:hypothetical protein
MGCAFEEHMRPIVITRTLTAADANGIAQAQQLLGPGALTLNGDLVVSGVAQLGSQRKVGIASTGDLSLITFTVYGTNQAGLAISESLAGPNNNTVSTTLDFLTVTQVAASAAVSTDVEVGTTAVGASQPIPLDLYLDPFNVSLFIDVTGTVNATLEYTGDDNVLTSIGPFVWFAHSDLTNVVADDVGTIISPVTAVRLVTNSGSGSTELTVLQSGAAT